MTQTVHLGDLSVTIDGIDLRDIRWHGHEAVRRIYPVFQDRNWTNRPFLIETQEVSEGSEGVTVLATGTGSFDAKPLDWRVEVDIRPTGISYRFIAEASSSFLRNRLGMCVLHPMSASGAQVSVEHVDGTVEDSALPIELLPFQPFVDMRAITHELPDGGRATVRLLGETYEMEDHRNWTDASFKTYCTPITLPFPIEVAAGDRTEQSIAVSFAGGGGTTAKLESQIEIAVHDAVTELPGLGVCLSADDLARQDAQLLELAALELDHVRVDVEATAPDAVVTVTRASAVAAALGTALHVAATCSDPADLAVFADLPDNVIEHVRTLYVFSSKDKVTSDSWANDARIALGDGWSAVLLGGGTDLYFTELNREPPDPLAFDALNFSLNPQVHAFDNRTLIQNSMTQQVVAADAPRLTDPARISVSPISLRPRFNPNATDPASDVSNTDLPNDVDARQQTYFAANWTAMSIKYLAAPGTIDTATYFEAFGWKGLGEPGAHFPVWKVFASLAGMTHAHVCESSAPEAVDALIASNDEKRIALVANWTDHERSVRIGEIGTYSIPPHDLTIISLPNN